MRFIGMKIFILILLSSLVYGTKATRLIPQTYKEESTRLPKYNEAPGYVNRQGCPGLVKDSVCDPSLVHVAMTLDSKYLRGSIASVHSILKHTLCPENIYFHFIASKSESSEIGTIIESTFPSLAFQIYPFDKSRVKNLISASIRRALDEPLNYARIYLTDLLPSCVNHAIYLDSDTLLVDDIKKLWSTNLKGKRVIGAPEYCHVNFMKYFNARFWSDPVLSRVFEGKRPCYFNTGVMVVDLVRWREGEYTRKIENWMEIQKEKRIYELGSLPPFLLVFGGEIEAISHRWNQHGLGGDNVVNSCRNLHPGPVSLLHWSGKEKPWVRLDAGRPCPVDHLWAPYDLHIARGIPEQLRSE